MDKEEIYKKLINNLLCNKYQFVLEDVNDLIYIDRTNIKDINKYLLDDYLEYDDLSWNQNEKLVDLYQNNELEKYIGEFRVTSFKNYEDIWNNLEIEWLDSDYYIANSGNEKFSLTEIFDVLSSLSDNKLYEPWGEWVYPLTRLELFEIGLGDIIKEHENEEFGENLELKYEYQYDRKYDILTIDDCSPEMDQTNIYIQTNFQQIWDKIRFEDDLIFLDYDCYRPQWYGIAHGEEDVWYNTSTNYYLAYFLTYNSSFLLDFKYWLKKNPLLKEYDTDFTSSIISKVDEFIKRNDIVNKYKTLTS